MTSKKNTTKLKIGQHVYCIDEETLEIYGYEVLAIGKDIFIPKCFKTLVDEWQTIPLDKTFTRIDDAKVALRQEYLRLRKEKRLPVCKLIKHDNDWYAYVEVEKHHYERQKPKEHSL